MSNKRNSSGDNTSAPSTKKTKPEPSKILPSPLTSPSDKKSYRHIQLPNGLRCILISDSAWEANPSWSNMNFEQESYRLGSRKKALEFVPPHPFVNSGFDCDGDLQKEQTLQDVTSKFNKGTPVGAKAAMCLVVEAGSLDDPPQYQGLAHFTEHMLHYGSKKYPNDGIYWNFVKNHGTHINAYTQCHTTAYQVAINPDFLEDALDLLGSSVSEPLFADQTTVKEVEAVDSEFQYRSGEDILKIQAIVKQSARKGHPLRKFSCGNRNTLKGKNLVSELRKFHSDNYIAQRMTFAIQSTESLDSLQEMVENSMSGIKSGVSKQQVKTENCDDVFDNEAFSKSYKIQGERKLILFWKFDSAIWKDFKSKPLRLLEVLMNDGDKGSLRDIFLKKGWILGMEAKSPKYEAFQNHYCTLFGVFMILTEAGQNNVKRIVQIIFDYIDMLRDTPQEYFEYIWEELQKCAKQAYDRCGNGSALNNTHYVARRMMTNGNSPSFLSDEIVFQGPYNPGPLKNVLKSISAKKTLYIQFIPGELPDNPQIRKMEHYNFKYSMDKIPQTFTSSLPEDRLEFPNKNIFITNRFHIRYNERERILAMDNKLNVILAPNIGITTAKCRYQIVINSSEVKSEQLLELFLYNLELKIQNEVTQASRAGIKTMIRAYPSGIILVMSGFPEKMPVFLDKFCQIFDNNAIDNFQTIKQFGQLAYSISLKVPRELMRLLVRSIHEVDQKSILETPNTMDSLTEEELKIFTKLFKSSMNIECLLEGNVSHQEAVEVTGILRTISYSGMADADLAVSSTSLLMPQGERTLRIRAVNSRDWNNVVTNMYQTQKHDKENFIMCYIVASLMGGRAFQILRTREQLGYVVHVVPPSGIPVTFQITVMSPQSKHSVCSVNERIDNFLGTFYDDFLAKMTSDEFRDFKINLPIKDYVSLHSVQTWYKANVFDMKISKLRKISLQVIGSQNLPGAVKCSCELCKSLEFKSIGNNHVQFAAHKVPNSTVAQKRKVIESISNFHNDEVRR